MSLIRAFIAITLNAEVHHRLAEVITAYQHKLEQVPVRWVTANNIHLTLKFLGDVSIANLDVLKKLLQAEVAGFKPFELSVGGSGAFPTVHRPRVIWVGVQAPADLGAVQSSVESMTARMGYPAEERPFSPHLTLGRVSRNATPHDFRMIATVLEKEKVGFLGAMCVRSVELYKSDLRPSGAIYTTLFAAPLSAEHH